MNVVEKLKTGLWFLRRPRFWAHAREIAVRKALPNHDTAEHAAGAGKWASERAVSVAEALKQIELQPAGGAVPFLPMGLMREAQERARQSAIVMGGPCDVNLLYAATILSGAERVIETGVAYGWSTLAILAALEGREAGKLVSVDMPYPKMNNEAFVGIVVPERLRGSWEIVREPDRHGLKKAIAMHSGSIHLCHYDSDKSWWGRQYGFKLLWKALVPGGVFISDDIQDNMAFAEFVENRHLASAVTEFGGKYVGITRKPFR